MRVAVDEEGRIPHAVQGTDGSSLHMGRGDLGRASLLPPRAEQRVNPTDRRLMLRRWLKSASAHPESLEREKWEADREFRGVGSPCGSASRRPRSRGTLAGARWKSPVVVAILVAALAAAGNALVIHDERLGGEPRSAKGRARADPRGGQDRRPRQGRREPRFLLRAGLIDDGRTRARLTTFLDQRKPGTGPTLPQEGIFGRRAETAARRFAVDSASRFRLGTLQPRRDVAKLAQRKDSSWRTRSRVMPRPTPTCSSV